jgi:hypothetical protein
MKTVNLMCISRRVLKSLVAVGVGACLGAVLPGVAQTIPNPSFETDTFTVFPGYISLNAPITGWTASPEDRAGLNPSDGSPFADNGTIPAGSKVAFIQSSDFGTTLGTTISGLTLGTPYRVTFRANARAGNTPNLKISLDDGGGAQEALAVTVQAVTGSNPYWYVAFEFTATATSETLTLLNDASGDHTVLVDDFRIAASAGTWTVAAWTGDADSGVDPGYLYTHAYNFASGVGPVINGVAFTGIPVTGVTPAAPGRFTSSLFGNVFLGDSNSISGVTISGASAVLAADFVYGGNVPANSYQGLTLQGLTPDAEYVLTLFTVGWEEPNLTARWATFGVGDDRLTINQDKFGNDNGAVISCRYRADANGSATVRISPLQPANLSIHIYGFCNREAVSRNFAPVISLQPLTRTVGRGQPATLSVVANGVPAPTYQWRFNGQNISGATSASHTMPQVQPADAGNYTVVVANSAGSVTSAVARLTVGVAIANPSFEADTFVNGPGYVSDNTPITGWTASPESNVGLNPAESSPFADNGLVPDGNNVAFLQSSAGVASLSTPLSDLTIGATYKVALRVNARGDQTPNLNVSVDDGFNRQDLLAVTVRPVGRAKPYWYAACEFTATDSAMTLTLANDAAGDHALLIDDVTVAPSSGNWRVALWTSDENSGVDGNYFHTHAYNFNSSASPVINGITFTGVPGTLPAISGRFTTTLFRFSFLNDANNVVGNSRALANDFLYAGDVPASSAQSITIQGLTPGKEYIATLYTVAFEDPGPGVRWATYSVGEDRLTINQDQFRNNNGMTIAYRYVADASGSVTLRIAPLQPANMSIHIYGFSNREATTPNYVPIIVAQPQDQRVAQGGPAIFRVTAAGLPEPTYQWRFNGTAIPDATTASLTLPAVADTDAGNYDVVVRNSMGARTSAVARLIVGLPMANSSFEADTFGNWPGYVSGNMPITGWNALGGHGINPANGSPFADNGLIPNGNQVAFMQENGAMSQLVSGFTVGDEYYLHYYENARTVTTVPALEAQLGGVTIVPTHTVTPVGGANPYREVFSDVFVAAATDLELAFIKSAPQGGDCTVLIDNVGFFRVPPGTAPFVSRDPQSTSVFVGGSVTFTAQGIGSTPLTYQWLKNGAAISGANGPSLTLDNVQQTDEADYSARVRNAFGSDTSAAARLTVYEAIPDLFNTGVDNNRVTLPDGSVDPHYRLVENPDTGTPEAIVQETTTFPIVGGPWLRANSTSGWVGPRLNTAASAVGFYTYRTVIDLTDRDPRTVVIQGRWSTDNGGRDILVNGVSTRNTHDGNFGAWGPFALYGTNAPFVAGSNAIDFIVENVAAIGYTGLRAEILFSNVRIPPGVPPQVTTQPADATVAIGDTVTFTAAAQGTAPLSYQWLRSGLPLAGQTGLTLTLANVTREDSGAYSVRVVNSAGSTVSDAAELCVCRSIIPGIFGTGVDDSGALLPDASVDPHYLLSASADPGYLGPDAMVVNTAYPIQAGVWLLNGPRSKWIAPQANQNDAAGGGNQPGNYTFQTTVDLTGYDLSQVSLSGGWAVDNSGVDLLINGQTTGLQNNAGFGGLTPFTLTSANGLVAGLNTIDFMVANAGTTVNPLGLRVDLRGLLNVPPVPRLAITRSAGNVQVAWSPAAAGQVLQGAPALTGPWSTIANAANPYVTAASGPMRYFRVVAP